MRTAASSLFRHRQARRLWYASACAAMAAWMLQIAVAVEVLATHPPATLAAIVLIGTLPTLFLMPIAGTLADRYDSRRLAIVSMAAQVLCVVSMAAASAFVGLLLLSVLYGVQGATAAFWAPARQQWLYGIIPQELRPRANAALGSLNGLMTLLGAAGGGVLSVWSPALAMLTAGVILTVSVLQLFQVERPPTPSPPGHSEPVVQWSRFARDMFVDLKDGLAAARRFPLAQSVIWIGIAWGIVGGGYTVLLTSRITGDPQGGPATLGLVFALDGLAVIVATWFAGRLPRRRHLSVWALCYVVQGFGWVAVFVAPSLPVAVACLVLMRLAGGFIIGLDMTILLETVPAKYRGRMTSVHVTTYSATGRLALGILSGLLAVSSVAAVGIVTGLLSAMFGLVWWLVSGRKYRHAYIRGAESTGHAVSPHDTNANA